MTSKLTTQDAAPERLEQFPQFPPRDDMQNFLYLYRESYPAALIRHFENRDTTLVLCEAPVYWYPTRYARIPDLLVAFDVDPSAAINRNGYSIEEHGKPPDFVLEVASATTARNDYTGKRQDYAAFGIPEYWRFDPTGGERYDAPLAGDRLVDGAYQLIDLTRSDDHNLWGHSTVLNLTLCWEDGRLRWWDPATGQYLLTNDEEASGRIAEREARLAAEARVRELEAELSRRDST